MKTIIEMAREAGIYYTDRLCDIISMIDLERFAELVRADERDRAMRENAYVLAEREACAKVCESIITDRKLPQMACAEAIRARGNT